MLAARTAAFALTPSGLAAWREALHLTQPGAAFVLGIPVATYRNYEQGRYSIPLPLAILTRYIAKHGML